MRLQLLIITLALALALVASPAPAMDNDDSLIGTIESIAAFSPGGSPEVQYFVITFKEYQGLYFKMLRNPALAAGIYDKSAPGGFNRARLDALEGRQAEVRVRPEKPGQRDRFIVKSFRLLK